MCIRDSVWTEIAVALYSYLITGLGYYCLVPLSVDGGVRVTVCLYLSYYL